MSYRDLTLEIIEREGGYVNDPDDRGGATKFGVTLQTLRDYRNNQALTADDVKDLTKGEAIQIFEAWYLIRPKINKLPERLIEPVYDMQINAGSRAVKLLQQMLVRLGWDIAVDGGIGPQTLGAVQDAVSQYGVEMLRDAYGRERIEFYYNLADNRPSSRKYATTQRGTKGGWITRAEEMISPEWHVTRLEHQERTASW